MALLPTRVKQISNTTRDTLTMALQDQAISDPEIQCFPLTSLPTSLFDSQDLSSRSLPENAANQSTISAGKVSHRGTLNTSQVVVRADDTRDRIIGMYKDEIKSHSARERDFVHLQDLIADLERKTRLL